MFHQIPSACSRWEVLAGLVWTGLDLLEGLFVLLSFCFFFFFSLIMFIGLPSEQKIGVKQFWVRESGGGAETLEKQGRKFSGKESRSKFAEKFAGNFPKIRQAKIENSPQIRSAEPWVQYLSSGSPEGAEADRLFKVLVLQKFCGVLRFPAKSATPDHVVSRASRPSALVSVIWCVQVQCLPLGFSHLEAWKPTQNPEIPKLRWPGDSQSELGRFARIDSQRKP